MTNGAVLSLLKLTKVIIYVDKEIFLCILFFCTLFCKDVLLQILQVLCTCPQYKLLLLIVIISLCVLIWV